MMHPVPILFLAIAQATTPDLEWVGRYVGGAGTGAEIVSVQAATRRLALSYSKLGAVDLLTLADPKSPRRLARFEVGLAQGEELTSVAFHPNHDWFLCAVQAADPEANGFVSIRSATDGRELARVECGVGPDAVTVDPTGRHALVANEGESVFLDPETGHYRSPAGSLSLIRFGDEAADARARQLALEPLDDPDSLDRTIEREVDGEQVLVPLRSHGPAWLEPEVCAFDPSGTRAFVTLQENNAVARVSVSYDPESDTVVSTLTVLPLGTTRHAADLRDDDRTAFSDQLFALREPDGIAVTPDGKFFVTADEGDTRPKASETRPGLPTGGSRTVSVFRAADASFVGDTGAQIDRQAAAAGLYPDGRSDSKGCEPEMIVTFDLDGHPYAAVTLERADAVALIDLGQPSAPRVVSILGVAEQPGTIAEAPEGIAHYRDAHSGQHYLYTANEESGTLTALRVRPGS